jgi:hypothetical protein
MMVKFFRTVFTALFMAIASQVSASEGLASVVCNIKKPDYLMFLDFDASKGTVRQHNSKYDDTHSIGTWTGDMISWSSFEIADQSACLYALDPKRMLLQNACFHHIQGAIAYSSTISSDQGVMRCVFVK